MKSTLDSMKEAVSRLVAAGQAQGLQTCDMDQDEVEPDEPEHIPVPSIHSSGSNIGASGA